MDSSFRFLSAGAAQTLSDILGRRNPELYKRVGQRSAVSRSDADLIMVVLSEELTNNLDDDWLPIDYGRTVSTVMAEFNRARINEWP